MNDLNGWLVLDKPVGISSNFALTKIKRNLPKKIKIGHAGTLDPLAQGVLPVAIGEATKTVQYLMDADKEYEFDICWGSETTTADKEGEVTNSGGRVPQEEEVMAILPEFLGEINQIPPKYSALKINGKPAYELARQGLEIDLKSRLINIYELELLTHNGLVTRLRVRCGKGTYVRSLAQDIARKLGSFAHVSFLKRTRVGKFSLKNAIMLENLLKIVHNTPSDLQLFPVNFGLGDILAIEIEAHQAIALRNGLSIFLPDYSSETSLVAQVTHDSILQAMVNICKGQAKPLRVFNL